MTAWEPKRGDKCWACYDGKWGRRSPGVVLRRAGETIEVAFRRTGFPECQRILRLQASRISPVGFGGEVPSERARLIFGDNSGDWYSVFPINA